MDEQLRVALTVNEGRVESARLTSSRRVLATQALCGRALKGALEVLPLVFPLCGRAQQVAAARAVESSATTTLRPPHQLARRLLLAAEMLESHARSLWIEGPPMVDRAPDVERFVQVRRLSQRLAGALYPHGDGLRPGASSLEPKRDEIADTAATLEAAFDRERPPDDVAAAGDWIRDSDAMGARLIAHLFDRSWAGLAPAAHLAGRLEVKDVQAALDGDAARFSARPTHEGRPIEFGPLARHANDDRVRAVLSAWGPGLATRIWARSVDIAERLDELTKLAAAVAAAPAQPELICDAGNGTGMAETTRGPLIHRIEWTEGRVTRWSRVAPTEWTFHPEGIATQSLVGWPVHEAQLRARMLFWVLDPCVPFEISLDSGPT